MRQTGLSCMLARLDWSFSFYSAELLVVLSAFLPKNRLQPPLEDVSNYFACLMFSFVCAALAIYPGREPLLAAGESTCSPLGQNHPKQPAQKDSPASLSDTGLR